MPAGREQLAALDLALEAGPLAAGWEDQRWTLARVRDLVAGKFKVAYTIRGSGTCCTARLDLPVGRAPGHRARRRRGGGVEERDLAADKSTAAALDGWIVFEDECGQSMRPPRSRTWGRRGITPVIRVRGGGTGRVSVAGLACYRPGYRSRLIYRLHPYRGRKDETKAFTWTEYRDLLIAAHRQLPGGNVVLVWDNLNVHRRPELRAFTGAQAWLRVFRLPAYAPDLNPVEGIWSVLKGGVLANLAVASFAHLVQVIRHGLKKLQYQPGLIEGCLAGTGLALDQAKQLTDITN